MVVVSSSAVQLSYERLKELNIHIIDFPLLVNGEHYHATMDMTHEEVEKLRKIIKDKKNKVITSGLSYNSVADTYSSFKKDKVIHIEMSLKLSTATAQVLKNVRNEKDCSHVELFDSNQAASGLTIQVLEAAKALKKGMAGNDFMEFLNRNRSNTRHIGVLYDLFYLNRAGRVSFAKALLGTAFKILPILSSTDIPGSLQTVGKAKTQAQANQILMKIIEDDFNRKNGKSIACSIAYCGNRKADADNFKELLEKKGWPVETEIHYTQHSNLVHEGPEFFDMGYIIYT